jgi:hypothetical protein
MLVSEIGTLVFDHSPRELLHYLYRKVLRHKRLRDFDDRHPCVFVLSTGRAGTKTLASLFNLAPNILSYHEPMPSLYELSKLSYECGDDSMARKVLREAFLSVREERMTYSLARGKGYVETSPQATFLAPVILEAIPNVRFVHIVRDPRYVVRSAMRRQWYNSNPADNTRIAPRPDSPVGPRWEGYNAFQKNLWLWAETNQWIINFSSGLPNDRVLLVRSEDLFAAHEETIASLYAFILSPLPSRRKITGVLGKKLNAQSSGTFPEPSGWAAEMRADLTAIAGTTANLLGYEI